MLYRATGPLAGSIRVSLHIHNTMDGVPSTALHMYILNYIRVTIPSIYQGLKSDIPVNSFAAWFFVFVLLQFTDNMKKNL